MVKGRKKAAMNGRRDRKAEADATPAPEIAGPELHGRGPVAIVPPKSIAGNALMLVVAIMSFLACLTVGAVSIVRDAASDWQSDIAREVTIQVRPIEGIDIEAELARAAEIARAAPGIDSARIVSADETNKLLEPWLGAGLDIAGLPVPRLVVIAVADPRAVDFTALRNALADVRGASLDDHRVWTDRLASMARTTVFIGIGVFSLVLTATVLSVIFATRGAMAGNRDVIEVLHLVGAEDGFIAGEFQRHFMLLGLKGGVAGGGIAMLLFALGNWLSGETLGSPGAAQVNALFGGFSVGAIGYFGALGVIFLIAVLTAATSRFTVQRHLADLS